MCWVERLSQNSTSAVSVKEMSFPISAKILLNPLKPSWTESPPLNALSAVGKSCLGGISKLGGDGSSFSAPEDESTVSDKGQIQNFPAERHSLHDLEYLFL
jgi:hypothetical protein